MKRITRFISFVLFVTLMFTLSSKSFALNDAKSKKSNAVVLVLDVSGSMSGDRITKLKEATVKFAEEILNREKNSEISIVTFGSTIKILEFSNNYTEIVRFTSNISAGGGTNMTKGIETADKLLSDEKMTNYVKSIIIMSDGRPDNASSAKDAATKLFEKYNIYSIGLILSSDQKMFMQNIQNKGYFDANNLSDLINSFLQVAEEILPFFEIELNYQELTIVHLDDPTQNSYAIIEITAIITNTSFDSIAKNVKAKIKIPDSLELNSNDTIEKSLGNINCVSSRENVATVKWKLNVPVLESDKNYQYSIVVGADNVVALEKFQTMSISNNRIDHTFNRNDDMWGFSHGEVGSYQINQEHLEYLLKGVGESENIFLQNTVEEIQKSNWGGSCFGLSKAALLFKLDKLTPEVWSSTKQKTLNKLTVEETRSLINYYYFTQYTSFWRDAKVFFNEKHPDLKERISELINTTRKVKTGGTPVLFGFSWKENIDDKEKTTGHAIVAYDVETSDSNNKGNPWIIDGIEYTTRIVTYDVNTQEGVQGKYNQKAVEDAYIYITENKDDWTIPRYIYSPRYDKTFNYAINDINILDKQNIENRGYVADEEKNKYAYLTAESNRANLIAEISNETQKSVVKGDVISGNLPIWTIYEQMSDSDETSTIPTYALNNTKSSYLYQLTGGAEKVNLKMLYTDSYFRVQADKLLNVNFVPEDEVAVNTLGGYAEINMTLNEEFRKLPWWTVSVISQNSEKLLLKNAVEGIIVGSNNLEGVVIKGSNGFEEKELLLNTKEEKVLVSEKQNELVAMIDKNKDGIYDTIISSSNEKLEKGKCIKLGSYPQTEVTDATTLKKLNSLSINWNSYDYSYGKSITDSTQATTSDYMQYADIVYGGEKYRAVKMSQLRPSINYYPSSTTYSEQDDNGYDNLNKVYWFKYEPLKWIVLDSTSGLVMCKNVIDSQEFNKKIFDDKYGDSNHNHFANNYEQSSIRNWLNKDFYNIAFSSADKTHIEEKTLSNVAYDKAQFNSGDTTDKITLLSFAEYQKIKNDYRLWQAGCSNYALCQGVSSNSGNTVADWMLRTAGTWSDVICSVSYSGAFSTSSTETYNSSMGIRPVVYLKTKNSESKPKVQGVSVGSDIKINYKKSETINYSVTADKGAKYSVSFTSSNPKVVTVDENGKVYAAKKGSATITCTVTDSNGNTVQDTCKVTVKYSFGQWLIKILLFGWIWY